jgi:hypothetical protein
MKTNVGLWIDNKNAIILFVSDKKIEEIIVKPNNNQLGGITKESSSNLPAVGKFKQIKHSGNYQKQRKPYSFYHDVMSAIRKAESIFIMGNGENESLLIDELEKNNLGDRIAAIETNDKLVMSRLAYKVQSFFHRHKTLKCA